MKYKLIGTDMDGTLLNDNHELTEGNIKAIVDIQKKGVKFVLASGRPSFAMLNYAKQLEMDKYNGYIIAFNGGQLIDMSNGKVIFHEGLDKNDIEKIYEVSEETGIPMVLYAGDTLYSNKNTELVQFEVSQCGMKFYEFKSIDELFGLGIKETTKCMFIDESQNILKVEEYMKSKYGKDYFIAISAPIFLEIANKNVDKGKTMKKLGEITGISLNEMIAVGDGNNDVPMLAVVEMPVAVSNANSRIKEMSKFESSDNNNDALKIVIEHFFK
ncbi:HAD family phosphatase [Leptotrichia sp. OH3620_COT-345]|uniref:Cof-type HAD-IIB family hydrolase n=1 Tax=Leptotrichia sp. OH3620_COT-345 TaxID=2491048 RepID=UPI000F64AA39|nr:Cof-type HAD-IIB family hydrolase [Leptotrichia sp. OH3620_COT-345]RRD40069.1 HAD family phosphatase [Leptotrichia sp. OH3620_COT-345]